MLLKILQAGDPVLRQPAQKVSAGELKAPSTQALIDLMTDTLRDQPGVGLAAPQVGESRQIIVVEDKAQYHEKLSAAILKAQQRKPVPLTVIVNPVLAIEDPSPVEFFEGCLSVTGYRGVVSRSAKVRVTGLDRHGKPLTITAQGWYARILQHEIDHLTGKLFVDTMYSKTFMSELHFQHAWSKALPKQIASLLQN